MTGQPARTLHLADCAAPGTGRSSSSGVRKASSRPAVYNTTGLNDCPAAQWRSLDPGTLAKDFGVPAVYLNGPRFWTMDQITAHGAGEILSFDGLDARWVAELPIPPELDVTGPPPRHYRDITIKRQTAWIFAAGRPVYELLTRTGRPTSCRPSRTSWTTA